MQPFNDNERVNHNEHVQSVSQVTANVRFELEQSFPLVWIEGEVSNFHRPSSGHWYFSLKDDKAQLRCAMFVNRNRFIRHRIGDGQHVVIRGRLTIFEARGEFQAIVDHVEPAGEGALRAAFERLKIKLEGEGLFDPARRKPLPRFPRHIGVLSSLTGAASRDVFSVIARRFPAARITLVPSAVQGAEAEREILRALDRAQALQPDVLIVTRGGGSLEDLWAFNLESVARRIATLEIPVISAIGHETDFTIADFVADQRAPTPSAAAELATPDRAELTANLANVERLLSMRLESKLAAHTRLIASVSRRLVHPGRALELKRQRILDLRDRLARKIRSELAQTRMTVSATDRLLRRHDPTTVIAAHRAGVSRALADLHRAIQRRVETKSARALATARALNAVNPLATLDRGYAIVAVPDGSRWGRPVTSIAHVQTGDEIVAHVADGAIVARVDRTGPRAADEG